jgi:hypothetical protein
MDSWTQADLVKIGEHHFLQLGDLRDDPAFTWVELVELAEGPQVHRADGVAMGAVVGVIQGLGKSLFDPSGDRVFDLVSLAVYLEPGHPEVIDQEALDEAMTAKHCVGKPPPLWGEEDGSTLFPRQVTLGGQSLEHLGSGGERNLENAGEHGGGDALAILFQPFDLFEVVLDPPHQGPFPFALASNSDARKVRFSGHLRHR